MAYNCEQELRKKDKRVAELERKVEYQEATIHTLCVEKGIDGAESMRLRRDLEAALCKLREQRDMERDGKDGRITELMAELKKRTDERDDAERDFSSLFKRFVAMQTLANKMMEV